MLNYMIVAKLNKTTFNEWKQGYIDSLDDKDRDAFFMRDVMIGKVDEHTAIICADVFDRELQKKILSDPAMIEIIETLGIEYVEYELNPAPTP